MRGDIDWVFVLLLVAKVVALGNINYFTSCLPAPKFFLFLSMDFILAKCQISVAIIYFCWLSELYKRCFTFRLKFGKEYDLNWLAHFYISSFLSTWHVTIGIIKLLLLLCLETWLLKILFWIGWNNGVD